MAKNGVVENKVARDASVPPQPEYLTKDQFKEFKESLDIKIKLGVKDEISKSNDKSNQNKLAIIAIVISLVTATISLFSLFK